MQAHRFTMAREYNFYVYLLTNEGATVLYIGVTNNLENRLHQHRRGGHQDAFTKRYRLTRLMHYEHFRHVFEALDREKQLKGWSRTKKNALVTEHNPRWADLSAGWPGRMQPKQQQQRRQQEEKPSGEST